MDLDPQTVLADYDQLAIRNSVSSIWPSTVVRGCLFHFKQAMLRNAGSMGLASFYKIIGSPVRRAIQLLGALAFVPEGDVYEVYHKIKPTLTDDVGEFLEYMESTWIGSPGSPAKYPPSEWNQHTYCLDKLCRSSNQIEGWHNGFNRIVECSHPSFHIFCEAILTEQGLTAGKISQHKKKRLPAVRRKKWVALEQPLRHDFDKAEEFLAYMGYTIFTPVQRHLVDE